MTRNRSIFKSFVNICKFTFLFMMFAWNTLAADQRDCLSLDGAWLFKIDPENKGMEEKWFEPAVNHSSWQKVIVPHTWQVEPGTIDYAGYAWYSHEIAPDPAWNGKNLKIEFDAVYRDVQVWLNGKLLGEHIGSGWTPFEFSLNKHWDFNGANVIVLRVDNRFSKNALPYLDSFDWPRDGGIIRSVRIRILPDVYIGRLLVHAEPENDFSRAALDVRALISGNRDLLDELSIDVKVYDPQGKMMPSPKLAINKKSAQNQLKITCKSTIPDPDLWHFDDPNLYRICYRIIDDDNILHEQEETFGIRKVEVKDGYYYLNGEPARLMGVEWMPGSDPRYGMAQDPRIIREILTDMKRLNCVITRFHWQQDESIFDFCDREGILVQEEVPAWGGKTMQGDLEDIQERHLTEMITAHYNHPSIYAWGLCNEIGGQSKKAHQFVSRGKKIAHELDPHRLLTYASNSLQSHPERDAAGMLDFIEWNDYYESWYGGGLPDLISNLDLIKKAFPDKSLVISEYGLCECSPGNPSGDERRIEILKTHTHCYRYAENVAGAIFFDYNDYRTHIGDKGQGSFKQRVHGVVDVFSKRKPSWEALRRESSPILSLDISKPKTDNQTSYATVEIVTRSLENDLPAYTLKNYLLTWIVYNKLNQPMGTGKRVLPDLPPGSNHTEKIDWPTLSALPRVRVEIFRPTGYSVIDKEWKVPRSE